MLHSQGSLGLLSVPVSCSMIANTQSCKGPYTCSLVLPSCSRNTGFFCLGFLSHSLVHLYCSRSSGVSNLVLGFLSPEKVPYLCSLVLPSCSKIPVFFNLVLGFLSPEKVPYLCSGFLPSCSKIPVFSNLVLGFLSPEKVPYLFLGSSILFQDPLCFPTLF